MKLLCKIMILSALVISTTKSSFAIDLETLLKRTIEVVEKQQRFQFKPGDTISVRESLCEGEYASNKSWICVVEEEGGLVASRTVNEDGILQSVNLMNSNYGAHVLAREYEKLTVFPRKLAPSFSLKKDPKMPWELDGSVPADPKWIRREIRRLTTRIGLGMEYSEGMKLWRQQGGRVEFLESGPTRKLHELIFTDWPNTDDGKMVYRFDPVQFTIQESELLVNQRRFMRKVLRSIDLEGLPYPQETLMTWQDEHDDDPEKGESRREWKLVDRASVGFSPEQLQLAYYGINPPVPENR